VFSDSVFPGKVFLPIANANFIRSRISALGGSLVTLPEGTLGNNAGADNFLGTPAAAISAAQFAAGLGAESAALGSNVTQVPADLAQPMVFKLTTEAQGTDLVLRGRIYIPGYLVDR